MLHTEGCAMPWSSPVFRATERHRSIAFPPRIGRSPSRGHAWLASMIAAVIVRVPDFPVELRAPMPLRSPAAIAAALLLFVLAAIPARATDFTDAAGRRIVLPPEIRHIMAANP